MLVSPIRSRRSILESAAALALAGLAAPPAFAARRLFSAIGITAKIERAAELKALGADFIVESVADFLIPNASDAEFAPNRESALAAPLRIRGCNSFLRDPSLICVGPKADHPRVLDYAATAFARLQSLGGEYIVFGSNSARRIPEGWSKPQADQQFIALLTSMAPVAGKHGITIGVEMQRSQECNYLNHIDEVVNVVAPVNHRNIRVLADLYHMRVMGDTPEQLAKAMRWVGVVELAEREQRTLPGVAGDDFRPYFAALARGKYRGLVDIEGDGTAEQLRNAFATVREQAADAS
ncbi:MAG TPA: TIM barrel protein [Steroidobacteraceae bacterium]|jgi:sugar phosphate isomerase/epimerase|nr:TIM barrel protein [Steroidobacteraceae bacterium]